MEPTSEREEDEEDRADRAAQFVAELVALKNKYRCDLIPEVRIRGTEITTAVRVAVL